MAIMAQHAKTSKKAIRARRRRLVAACLVLLATALIVGIVALIHHRAGMPGDPGVTDPTGAGTRATDAPTQAPDVTPPVIEGVKELFARQGGTVKYLTDITVTDDRDENLKVNVDADKVDLRQEGDYPVTYWAVDAAGNRAEVKTVVHVQADYVDLDIVSALARFIREIQRPLERSGRVFMVDVISVERIIPEGGEKDGCS